MSTLKVEQVLHMNGGAGDTSYAANSKLQERAIFKTKTVMERAINEVYDATLPANLVVADLGCSSGPNTFLAISQIIAAVGSRCRRLGRKPPEIQCFLNDLPGNDFDTTFRYAETLEELLTAADGEEVAVPYHVVGVLGTFYGRLFPSSSVHFIHSSYSLMWLSRVPRGLESGSFDPVNRGSIYISSASPPRIITSYLDQFTSDLSKFLGLRSKEIVNGERMVLTFLGRKSTHAPSGELSCLWGLLAAALNAMVVQGLLHEEEVDSFNLPFYAPSLEEVKTVIQDEASFSVDGLHTFVANWDPFDDSDDDDDDKIFDTIKSGENVANCIRAVIEPMLARHFGHAIMDELFSRFATNVANHLLKEKTKYVVFVVSLKK